MGHATTKRLPIKREIARKARRRSAQRPPLPEKPSTYSLRVAQNLRQLRLDAGLSVTDMSNRVTEHGYDLGRAAYSHYELGRRPFPLELVPYIVLALGIKVTDLLPSR